MAGATEYYAFSITAPAGTPIGAPITTNITMPTRIVRAIRARIPDGWNGVVGFALAFAGKAIIPTMPNTWIIASGESIPIDVLNQPESGAWQVQMYNTGVYPHTLTLYFTVELPDVPDAAQTIQPVTIAPVAPTAVIVAPMTPLTVPAVPAVP